MVIGVHSRHQWSTRGPPYAVFDPHKPTRISYGEVTFTYPFKTSDWHSATTARGLTIEANELEKIYYKIGESMQGGYAKWESYVKPDAVSQKAGDYYHGAWRVQVMVNDFVWKYRIAQGEGYVSCKQNWQNKVTTESDFGFFDVTWDVDYYYETRGTACTFQIISPLIPQVLQEIDGDWKRRNIGHGEL